MLSGIQTQRNQRLSTAGVDPVPLSLDHSLPREMSRISTEEDPPCFRGCLPEFAPRSLVALGRRPRRIGVRTRERRGDRLEQRVVVAVLRASMPG